MLGRFSGSKGCTDAAAFIKKEFEKAGLKALSGNDGFYMPVTSTWGNVVGAIQGKTKPNEVIIFSAHYDHIGTVSTNPYPLFYNNKKILKDSIFNGANDNASGVAAIISLANYYSKMTNIERTLIFVAFGGEELGLLGSQNFSRRVVPDSIKAVINIDMIGRKQFSNVFLTGSNYSNLYELLNRRLYKTDPQTYKKQFIRKEKAYENLFQRSDNFPFASKGIPAHTLMTTSDADIYYHSVNDEFNTLDYSFMSKVVKAIGIACEGLVTGEDTPTRIDIKKLHFP
jgi:Zn-dependent M28 family amino/carboxypeptidase